MRCSRGLPFGYMCGNHGDFFIGRLVEGRLVNLNGTREKRLYVKLTRYNADSGLLLFPFNMENAEVIQVPGVGKVLRGEFCLDPNMANQMIQRLVTQLNLSRDDEKRFGAILNSILGLGLGFFDSCTNLGYFVDFAKQLDKIKPRLQNCYLRYDQDDTDDDRYVSLDTLPPFYQGLLYNVEMSTIRTAQGDLELTPNLGYDQVNHKFVVDTSQNIYLCRDDATDGTDLVLDGIRQSTLYDPFNIPDQENARYVGFNDVQPLCRRTAGDRIVYGFP